MRDRFGQCLSQNLNPNILNTVSMILTTVLKERNFKNPSLKDVFPGSSYTWPFRDHE